LNLKNTYYPNKISSSQKLMVEIFDGTATTANTAKTRYYLGGLVMKGSKVEFINTPEGRAIPKASVWTNPNGTLVSPPGAISTWTYEYQLKDHLGNLRVACRCGDPKRNTNNGNIQVNATREPAKAVQTEDYDAWGLSFGNPAVSSSGAENLYSKYLYNGKEQVQDLNIALYEYGFRWYDAQTAKFVQVDPLAEKYTYKSTYDYAENRPISGVDLDGLEYFYSADGKFLGKGKESTNEVRLGRWNSESKLFEAVDINGNSSSSWVEIHKDHEIFKKIVGTIYSEVDEKKYSADEASGMVDLLENRGGSVEDRISDKSQVFGFTARFNWKGDAHNGELNREIVAKVMDGGIDSKTYKNGRHFNSNRITTTTFGVIRALVTPNNLKDYSNGASNWQGRDVGSSNRFYSKDGIDFCESAHNLYKTNYSPIPYSRSGLTVYNKYESTGAAGGTVFLRRTPQSLKLKFGTFTKTGKGGW